MIILGLTGSIGMGKSATADMFRGECVPVFDADETVHALYAEGGAAVVPIEAAFPGVTRDSAIDRASLRARVLNDVEAMKQVEAIVHPLAGEAQMNFRKNAEAAGEPFAVLDIPLLYETGGWKICDHVAIVSAPEEMQRARVLARKGMTEEVFAAILARQMPDAEKRARADFVISTAYGFDFAHAHVRAIKALMIRLHEEASK